MKSSTLDLVLLTALAAGLAYFSVDALFGEDGVRHVDELRGELSKREQTLTALEVNRAALASRVEALSGAEIDRDLLDERLRAVYGVGRDDEVLLQAPTRNQ